MAQLSSHAGLRDLDPLKKHSATTLLAKSAGESLERRHRRARQQETCWGSGRVRLSASEQGCGIQI